MNLRIKSERMYRALRIYLLRWKRYNEAQWYSDFWNYMKYVEKMPKKEQRLEPHGECGNIMFIGTNPSIRSSLKDMWNDPYGRYFGKQLEDAGIDRTQHWFTNLFKYPTWNNRPLRKDEMESGMVELAIEIEAVKPKKIIAFGKQVGSVFGLTKPYTRGIDPISKKEVVYLPHPSFINRYATKEERELFIEALKQEGQYV